MKTQLPVYRAYFNSEHDMRTAKDKLFAVHGVEADDIKASGEIAPWKLIYAGHQSYVRDSMMLGVKVAAIQRFDPSAQWDRGFIDASEE